MVLIIVRASSMQWPRTLHCEKTQDSQEGCFKKSKVQNPSLFWDMDVFQSRVFLHLLALNVVLLPLAHGIIHFYDFVVSILQSIGMQNCSEKRSYIRLATSFFFPFSVSYLRWSLDVRNWCLVCNAAEGAKLHEAVRDEERVDVERQLPGARDKGP